jgi:SAM-dependent methyltransferase
MFDAYGQIGIGSPSWLVKTIGERAYKEVFSCLGNIHNIGRLLDIGCGNGEKKVVIPENAHYIGMDHPTTLHEKSFIDIFATADDIPFTSNSFDTVLCTGVLEHLEEPFCAISEAFRILRPGGYAIYSAPLFWHIHEEPRDFYRYTRYGLEHLFKKAGFKLVRVDPLSGFWVTAGTMFNYYISLFYRWPLRPVLKNLIVINNLLCGFLDRHHKTPQFTWMYLVVARKPGTEEKQS